MKPWLAVSVVFVAACSGGSSSSSAIGPAGGTVSADGVTLAIPAGALGSAQQISITSVDDAPAGYRLSSKLYRFAPDGLVFAQPVSITIACDEACGSSTVYWSRLGATGYDALPDHLVAAELARRFHRPLQHGLRGHRS